MVLILEVIWNLKNFVADKKKKGEYSSYHQQHQQEGKKIYILDIDPAQFQVQVSRQKIHWCSSFPFQLIEVYKKKSMETSHNKNSEAKC